MTALYCYGCESLALDCCGASAVAECFSGLYVSGDSDTYIHHPFSFYASSGEDLVFINDALGNYATVYLSGTSYGDFGELTDFLNACKCGGVFREEFTHKTGTTLTFSGNSGYIPTDQSKCHLIVDGREKGHTEWMVSGSDIITTFNIFYDNKIQFWYQCF